MMDPEKQSLKTRLVTTILFGAVSGAAGFFVKAVLEAWQVLDPIAAAFGGWLKTNVTASQAGWAIALVVSLVLWGTLLWRTRPRHIHYLPVQAEAKPEGKLMTEVHRTAPDEDRAKPDSPSLPADPAEPEAKMQDGPTEASVPRPEGRPGAVRAPVSGPYPWRAHHEDDRSAWFAPGTIHTVTSVESGSKRIRLCLSEGRGYARIMPDAWKPASDAATRLQSAPGIPAIVGDARGFGWGISRGGMAVYRWADTPEQPMDVGALTQWFSSTGEFWGIANEFFFKDDLGERTLATTYVIKHWCFFLSRNGYLARSLGGEPPFHVRLGVVHLDDSWWPVESLFPEKDRFAAVEDSYEYAGALISLEHWEVFQMVADAFNGLAALYGRLPWPVERVAAIAGEAH